VLSSKPFCRRQSRRSLARPLERGRHGLGIGAIDGRIYVAGGGPNPDLSATDRVDVFTP